MSQNFAKWADKVKKWIKTTDKENFTSRALELFTFQFERNHAYRAYCIKQRKTPAVVTSWRDIPPVPIAAFKETKLSVAPEQKPDAVFMTSGTTDPRRRGRHAHLSLQVWDESMHLGFSRFVWSEKSAKRKMFVLFPDAKQNRHSSLARYLTNVVCRYGKDGSRFFFQNGEFQLAQLIESLKNVEREGEPLVLLGPSFSFVHLFDRLRKEDIRLQLPEGSLLFDTGGLKGKVRELSDEQYLAIAEERLGVKRKSRVNMFGMTEISSQMYSRGDEKIKKSGGWVQTCAVDPLTLVPLPMGTPGLLAHYDLANWDSCLAVVSTDLGLETEDGFVFIGRAQDKETRGCSAAVESILEAESH